MRVIIESPFANKCGENLVYLQRCLRFALLTGHAPMASHMLYTCALDDHDELERRIGIDAGLDWGRVAQQTWVFLDRGLSKGMRHGVEMAFRQRRTIRWWAFEATTIKNPQLREELVELLRGRVLLNNDDPAIEHADAVAVPTIGQLAARQLGEGLERGAGWRPATSRDEISAALRGMCAGDLLEATGGFGQAPTYGQALAADILAGEGWSPADDHVVAQAMLRAYERRRAEQTK